MISKLILLRKLYQLKKFLFSTVAQLIWFWLIFFIIFDNDLWKIYIILNAEKVLSFLFSTVAQLIWFWLLFVIIHANDFRTSTKYRMPRSFKLVVYIHSISWYNLGKKIMNLILTLVNFTQILFCLICFPLSTLCYSDCQIFIILILLILSQCVLKL